MRKSEQERSINKWGEGGNEQKRTFTGGGDVTKLNVFCLFFRSFVVFSEALCGCRVSTMGSSLWFSS